MSIILLYSYYNSTIVIDIRNITVFFLLLTVLQIEAHCWVKIRWSDGRTESKEEPTIWYFSANSKKSSGQCDHV